MKNIVTAQMYRKCAFFTSEAIEIQALKYGYTDGKLLVVKGCRIVPKTSQKVIRSVLEAFLTGDEALIENAVGELYAKSKKAGPECRMFCVCLYLLTLREDGGAAEKLLPLVYGSFFPGDRDAGYYMIVLAETLNPSVISPEIFLMLLIRQNGLKNNTDKALNMMLRAVKAGTRLREEIVREILSLASDRNEFVMFMRIINRLFPEREPDERGDCDEGIHDGRECA